MKLIPASRAARWLAVLIAPFLFSAAYAASLFFLGFNIEAFSLSLILLVAAVFWALSRRYEPGVSVPGTWLAVSVLLYWGWQAVTLLWSPVSFVSTTMFWWMSSLPLAFWLYLLLPQERHWLAVRGTHPVERPWVGAHRGLPAAGDRRDAGFTVSGREYPRRAVEPDRVAGLRLFHGIARRSPLVKPDHDVHGAVVFHSDLRHPADQKPRWDTRVSGVRRHPVVHGVEACAPEGRCYRSRPHRARLSFCRSELGRWADGARTDAGRSSRGRRGKIRHMAPILVVAAGAIPVLGRRPGHLFPAVATVPCAAGQQRGLFRAQRLSADMD